MSWFGKKDTKKVESSTLGEFILRTAHGSTESVEADKQVDLTATTLTITTYKAKRPEIDHLEIEKVEKIPRSEINNVSMSGDGMGYFTISYGKSFEEKITWFGDEIDAFEGIFSEIDNLNYNKYIEGKINSIKVPANYQYENKPAITEFYGNKINHMVSYDTPEEAANDLDRKAKEGWMVQSTSATDGHVNVGRTAFNVALLGPLGLIGGASRTKGKVTVTYVRTPQWMEEHNMGTKKPEALTTSGSNDVITQLERLAKLREQGVLTEEEFLRQKNKILNN